MPDLFLIINDAGVIECASAPVIDAFGYSAAELYAQPLALILNVPEQRAILAAPLAWLSASPHPILQGKHRDGRRFPLRLTQHEVKSGGHAHYVLLLQAPEDAVPSAPVFFQHEELYELATTQGRISVWEVDYRTNHFEFSPVLPMMLGLEGDQIPTTVEGWSRHFHAEDWRTLERESERMLRQEIPELNVECRMMHADGHMLWGLVRGKAIFAADGTPIKAIGTNIDITERKRDEQRATVEHAVTRVLAASPNLVDASTLILKALCETMDWEVGALWRVDTNAQVLRCIQTWHLATEAFDEFEAVSRETAFSSGIGLPGRVWASRQSAWVPDVGNDDNFPRAPVATRAGLHAALAFPILLENAVLGAIEFFTKGIRPPDQKLLQMMTAIGSQIGQFIERKKAEEERDLFFDWSLDLLCIADTAGFFRRVNPAFCKTLGYTFDELTTRPFFDFVHPDDAIATRRALTGLQHGEDVIFFENRYRCKDESYRWLSWKCPAPAEGSDLIYAVARDVTDAKRVQADLERAKQEAEHANRAKSDFLSRMSHELRTPLNAILGFGQLLQRALHDPRQRQQIDLIVTGGKHLLTLINEVLDITRIEVGRLDLSPESVDLADLVLEITNLSQPLAGARGIRVDIDHASLGDCCVLADKQRLKQVLLNLVSNAIKYTGENGSVAIRCACMPERRVQIQVSDDGPGIPLDKQGRLFTPFDRLGAETTPIEGSGLGLVLSKRLVEVMGGALTFVSQPGQGTTFSVELAQAKSVQALIDELPRSSSTAAAAGPARTVLYIEDNVANVQLVEAVLAYRPGIRLVKAFEGNHGLELARRHLPDLILLDVHLPDIQGCAIMATIRADEQLRATPVIVISADATKHQIERLLDAGANEYLTKPIDVDQFLRVLDHCLEKA